MLIPFGLLSFWSAACDLPLTADFLWVIDLDITATLPVPRRLDVCNEKKWDFVSYYEIMWGFLRYCEKLWDIVRLCEISGG